MPEKSSITHQFIARGLDQTSAIHNIEIGRSESMYNFDTDAHGFISKRKGYSLHRNIPIRITRVGDRGSNWELVAHPSIDLLGVPSGPVVVNGQAVDIATQELETVSFYWNTFENLGAFTINANNVDSQGQVTDPDGIYRSEVTVSHANDLNLLVGILQQDDIFSENNKAVLTDEIVNVKRLDGTFELDLFFESPENFGDTRYTVFKPDDNVVQNEYYHPAVITTPETKIAPETETHIFSIPQATHGLAGENYIVQVWANQTPTGSNIEERKIIFPDSIYISNDEQIDVTVTTDLGTTLNIYIIALNSGFQQAALFQRSSEVKDLILNNVTTNVNLWSLYRVDENGNQTLVIPDEVTYVGENVGAMPDEICNTSQPPLSLRFCFNNELDLEPASTYKAVYAPCVPVNAGILVPKIDSNTTNTANFDVENADLILHGIDWNGVVVNPLRSEFAYVREVEEYNSTVFKRLVAVCSGDFWIEDLNTTYTLTASQSGEQEAQTQYLTPYFDASDNARTVDGRNRGIKADEITDHKIEISSITNTTTTNGNGTAVVVCSELNGIQGNLTGLVPNIDKLTIEGDENNVYNGSHTIIAAEFDDENNNLLTFTIQVENLKTYSPSSANSSAVCGIFTDYILVSSATYPTFQVDDIINNISGILGSKVFALEVEDTDYQVWIDVVPQEVFLPGSVSITWDRITDTIVVDTLDQAVPFDIVNVSGFVRKFKIVEINIDNNAIPPVKSVKLNESIQVSNFFGNATTITLDGRLSLPLKPDKNIVKDFPFSPTGEYNAELAALNDSLYTSTYDRSVVKFDGTHISDAGILEYPIYSHSWVVPKVPLEKADEEGEEDKGNENKFSFINPNSITAKIQAETFEQKYIDDGTDNDIIINENETIKEKYGYVFTAEEDLTVDTLGFNLASQKNDEEQNPAVVGASGNVKLKLYNYAVSQVTNEFIGTLIATTESKDVSLFKSFESTSDAFVLFKNLKDTEGNYPSIKTNNKYAIFLDTTNLADGSGPIKLIRNTTSTDAAVQFSITKPQEETTFDFTSVTGSTLDVSGAAQYVTLFSANDETPYYAWFNVTDGVNTQTDPALGGSTGIEVEILAADLDADVATKFDAAVALLTDFNGGAVVGATATITNASEGPSTDATEGTVTGATVTITTQGDYLVESATYTPFVVSGTIPLDDTVDVVVPSSVNPSAVFEVDQQIAIETTPTTDFPLSILDATITDIQDQTISIKVPNFNGFVANDSISIFIPTSFGYYFRIEYTDRNNRIITGTPNSYINAIVTIKKPSLIMHALKLPTTSKGTTEWDRFKIGIYRTVGADSVSDVTPIFFKVDDTPALKNLAGSKASDAQAIHTVVIADTTTDGSLAPGKNNTILLNELRSGVNSGTDFISNAQISSLGGSDTARPIAAARPPQAQYLLSTNGHMVYGNIRSNSSLLTTWTKNKSGIKNITGSKVTLKSESEFSNYDIPVKFVDNGELDIRSIQKSDADTGSDFIDSENESKNVGFLKLEINGAITVSEGSYIQIISKDVSTANTENDFVGSLIGWHKITKIDGNFLFIRVPSFIADEFPASSSLTVNSIQAVFLGGNEVTDFDFNAISEDEIDVDGEGKYVTLFSANDETSYIFWFNVDGGMNTQTPPDIPESEVVEVNVLTQSPSEAIATAFAELVMTYEDFTVVQNSTTVTITNAIEAPSTDATAGTFTDPSKGVTVTVTSQGEFAIPCWDKDYADDFPSQDITLPSTSSQRITRNWAKAINTVMADNAYYARITEELGTSPVASLNSFNNIILGDWAYCKWGETVGGNNVEIVQQTSDSIQFYIETENLPDGFAIFSDGFISNNPIFAQPKVFPSRLVVSYRNYPESVDNPYADDQIKSFSAIDINASDGEEITGMATFFSESATGGAQYAGTVIVFKTSSVYAVDISTKQTQRLQSMGQGCTVPDSIASTDDTIFFANDTGVYKVTRDLNVKYVGDVLERYYDALPKGTLRARGYGIADNFDLNYQLAVPVTSTVNQEIAVYNFESMSKQAEGSWALYDSIPLSSAKQTSTRFFFGNFKGRIWEKRNAGDNSDYRDDDSAISATFTYAPQHFGDPGKTKDMSHTIVQYAGNGPSAATVGMALDLSEDFTTLDPTNAGEGNWKGINVAYSPPPAKAVFYQIKVEHDVKDEPCVINGFVFKVNIGNEQAIRQASDGANGVKK